MRCQSDVVTVAWSTGHDVKVHVEHFLLGSRSGTVQDLHVGKTDLASKEINYRLHAHRERHHLLGWKIENALEVALRYHESVELA